MPASWIHRLARSDARRYVPGSVRTMARTVLQASGLLGEDVRRLGLTTLYPDDTFVVSYPKSGNTWIRFLIANLQNPDATISFRNIERYVASIKQSADLIRTMDRPRYLKTHAPRYDSFPRFVYIYRDVRDVAVSYYHYSKQYGWFDGDFSAFIRSRWPWHESFGPWNTHVERALEHADRHPDDVLILQYEEMLEDPRPSTHRLAEFCGIDATDADVERVVEACRFDNLKKTEQKYGPESTDHEDVTFFRSGTRGQWKEAYTEADMEALLDRFGETLRGLDYPT